MASRPVPRVGGGWARRALVALGMGGLALTLATCRDATGPRTAGLGRVAVAPVLPSEAALAAFGLAIDRVRIVVVRPIADTLADTTVALPADATFLDLDLRVPLLSSPETLSVSIVALAGTMPLFEGTSLVAVVSGTTPPPPTEIPVDTYVGPGAGVDSIVVQPRAPFIYLNDSLRFQVEAFQAGVPVTQFYVAWSTSDTTVARINGFGVLRAPASRTLVRVRARTPAGVSDSVTATFVPLPTQLVVIAGSGQTGVVGQPLGTQLEVEVRAADNLPVGGVDIRFRSLSGGTPADTTVTSDAAGRAGVTGVLGTAVGAQSIQATLPAFPGVAAATFNVTATAGPISASTSVVTVSAATIASGATVTLMLQGKDAVGNNLTAGGATVVFSFSGGTSTGTIGATVDSANGKYTAAFTGVVAGTAITIGATIDGNPVTTALPTVTVTAAPAAVLALVSGNSQSAVAGLLLPAPLVVRVTDAFGNPVSGEPVAWLVTAGGGSVTPASPVTDAGGFASAQWTLALVAGTNVVQASSGKLAGSPAAFTAVGVPAGTTSLWVGGDVAAPTAWSAGANWQSGLVPTSSDNVYVPASAANQPVLGASAAVNNLALEAGASLAITVGNTLTVGGSLDATGAISGPGALQLTGSGAAMRGTVPTTTVTNGVFIAGTLTVNGALTVSGATANLNLNGQSVTVTGNVGTASGGTVTMQSSPDLLAISGNADFSGGSEATLLTAGTLRVGGAFSVAGATLDAFVASGTHTVVLNGSGPQSITVANPASSRFQNLEVASAGTATVAAGSALSVDGHLNVAAGTFDLNGQTVTVAGNFSTASGGGLRIAASTAVLEIAGNATFAGGNTSGLLFDGVLRIGGNFAQLGFPVGGGSFEGASLHVTEFNGTAAQTISFEDPVGSHFGNVRIGNTSLGGVNFLTDAFAAGQLQSGSLRATRTVLGNGHQLNVLGLDADGLVLDNLRLVVDEGFGIFLFQNMTLKNYDPTAVQLTLNRSGGTFNFTNVSFLTTPTTGRYISATDNTADLSPLRINMVSSTPLNGSTFTAIAGLDGGASVKWTELVWTGPPGNAVAGAILTPVPEVTAMGPLGSAVLNFGDAVTVAIGNNPGGGVLTGTTTIAAVNGVVQFPDLKIDKAATGYTLVASTAQLPSATSAGFGITAGAAAQLVFVQQPSHTFATDIIAPAVRVAIADAFGNVVPTATDPVTLAKSPLTGNLDGFLLGTTVLSAVNGVAAFPDLHVDIADLATYRLDASSGLLPLATSADFLIGGQVNAILVGTEPITIGVNSKTNKLYVANSNRGGLGLASVSVIDATKDVAGLPLTNFGTSPLGVGVNALTNKIYVSDATDGTLRVIDGATDVVRTMLTIEDRAALGYVAVDEVKNRVYVPALMLGGPVVMPIDGATDVVLTGEAIPLPAQGVGIAFNSKDGLLYVALTTDVVAIVDPVARTVKGIPMGKGAYGVAVNPATNLFYVTNATEGTVTVVDAGTQAVVATIPVGLTPQGLGVDPNLGRIFVANSGAGTLSIIDGVKHTVLATIPVGKSPRDAAYNPALRGRVYVPNLADNAVSVVEQIP